MPFEKLLKPAILLMDRLRFKSKILLSIAIMFIFLIAPSFIIVKDFTIKNSQFYRKLIGLSYAIHLNRLITSIQLHRGAFNAYANGSTDFLDDIEKFQKDIKKNLSALIELNKRESLLEDKSFDFTIKSLNDNRIMSIKSKKSSDYVFTMHSNIIHELMRLTRLSASKTKLSIHDCPELTTIGLMLSSYLPELQEYSGILRGRAVGFFAKESISDEEKKLLLYLMWKIDNQVEKNVEVLELYPIKSINKYLDRILDEKIKINDLLIYYIDHQKKSIVDLELLFTQATTFVEKQVELRKYLEKRYLEKINENKKEYYFQLLFLFTLSLLALALVLYISSSFYISVSSNLKKLSLASKNIGEGNFNIQIETNLRDEIGEALNAFSRMSYKIAENISFLNRYKMAIDETSIVSKTDKNGLISYVNEKFCSSYGYSKEEVIGKSHNIIRHPEMSKEKFAKLWETIERKKTWKGVIKNLSKDKKTYISESTILPILDVSGNILEYIAIRHDITELEKFKNEIEKHNIDLLTELPNRNKFLEDIKQAKDIGLIYLNINNFNGLNQFYGFKVADSVLVGLSSQLKEISQELGYKVYRLRSDDFLIFFTKNRLNRENYKTIAENIIRKVETKEIECGPALNISINLTSSVIFCSNFEENKNLLAHMEQARKIAKLENRKCLLYDANLDKGIDYKKNIKQINEIKDAIKNDRIDVYFQPIVDNKTAKVVKYEALVRLILEDGEILSPFFFLDIAIKANLYPQITKIVINKSFEKFYNLPYALTINLSIEDINDKETLSFIFKKLKNYPSPNNIVFEILESQEIKDYIVVKKFVKKVKKFGAKIAIDDFGSGYSNFEHIVNIGVDFIKIDGSLIKNINSDQNSRILVKSIINLSENLGVETIAEFVHSKEIYDIVKEMGANFSQGYYLGEPKSNLALINC